MIEVHIEKKANVDSEKVWRKLRDFGDLSWFPGPEKVESSGSGVGMVRRVYMPGGGHVEEKLESLDDEQKTFTYSIAKSPVFPFDNYQAHVAMTRINSAQTGIVWQCTFDVEGIPEAEARAMLEGTYAALIDALFASVEAS